MSGPLQDCPAESGPVKKRNPEGETARRTPKQAIAAKVADVPLLPEGRGKKFWVRTREKPGGSKNGRFFPDADFEISAKGEEMPHAHFQIPVQGGDEEDRFNQFLQRHRVIKLEKQFVDAGLDSFWAYHLQYDDKDKPAKQTSTSNVPTKKGQVDYKEILNEDDFSLYLQLREWRKARADEDNVEAYTIFTNAQLAEISQRRCGTLETLKQISGIGEGRIDKHGQAVLDWLKEAGSLKEEEKDA